MYMYMHKPANNTWHKQGMDDDFENGGSLILLRV